MLPGDKPNRAGVESSCEFAGLSRCTRSPSFLAWAHASGLGTVSITHRCARGKYSCHTGSARPNCTPTSVKLRTSWRTASKSIA